MKRLILFILLFSAGICLFAQAYLPEYRFASGIWNIKGDRLYQNDEKARLAKVNIKNDQSGPMIYRFNIRYEGGDWGGVGIHIFVEDIYHKASWGSGISYLLWLNYDEKPITKGIHKGLSAQVYRSYSSSDMRLLESVSLSDYEDILMDSLDQEIPITIWADGNTGEVRVYDPTDPEEKRYFYFYMDKKDVPMKGDWVSLRTNGLKVSFGW